MSLDATLALMVRHLCAWPWLNAYLKLRKVILPVQFGSIVVLLKVTRWEPSIQKTCVPSVTLYVQNAYKLRDRLLS